MVRCGALKIFFKRCLGSKCKILSKSAKAAEWNEIPQSEVQTRRISETSRLVTNDDCSKKEKMVIKTTDQKFSWREEALTLEDSERLTYFGGG